MATLAFAEHASALATPQGVSLDPAALLDGVGGLGPAPYLLRGAPVGAWQLELRHGCRGPAAEVGAARPGTFLYCVAVGGKRAWVTAVGLAGGARAGPRAVVSTASDDVGLVAFQPHEADDFAEDEAVAAGDVSGAPTPEGAPDSGR